MPPDLTGVTVLVVEDDVVSRRVYESLLRDLGATVRTAKEGFEALELLWQAPADVVLCDLRMPHFDGYAFIRGLRDDFKLQTPVIAITGTSREDVRKRSLDAGFAAHLTKPVDSQALGEAIARILRP